MSQAPMPGCRASECFATAARKASRRLTQFYDDALEPSGLRSTQYAILTELARSGARRRLPKWRARSFPTGQRSAII